MAGLPILGPDGEGGGAERAGLAGRRRTKAQRHAAIAVAQRRRFVRTEAGAASSQQLDLHVLQKDFDTTGGANAVAFAVDSSTNEITGTIAAAIYVIGREAGAPVRTVGASTTSPFTIVDLASVASSSLNWSAELKVRGMVLNNSGSTNPLRMVSTFGSTTLTNTRDGTQPTTGTDKRSFELFVEFGASGSTSAQWATFRLMMGQSTATSAGVSHHYLVQRAGLAFGTAAEDATSAKNIKVQGQWDNSHASSYLEVYSSTLTFSPGT